MTVIVAHDTPDAIRGMLKRWFIEPRPNVFVGTLNRRTHERTIEYIKRNATDIGLLIISSFPNCQGYKIDSTGPTDRKGIEVTGLWMVAEKWEESQVKPSKLKPQWVVLTDVICRKMAEFSPRVWGWSVPDTLRQASFPHACGDGPEPS